MKDIVVVAAVIIIVAWFLSQVASFVRRRKKEQLPAEAAPRVVSVTEASQAPEEVSVKESLVHRSNPVNELRTFIAKRKGVVDPSQLFEEVMAEFKDAKPWRIVNALCSEDVPVTAVAPPLFKHSPSLEEGVRILFEDYSPDAGEWVQILWPSVLETEQEAKAKNVLALVEKAEGADWMAGDYGNNSPETFVAPLIEQGLTSLLALKVVHAVSDLPLGTILRDADLPRDREIFAEIAKSLSIDFANEAEMDSLYGELDFSLEDVFFVLKANGLDALAALRALNEVLSDSIEYAAAEILPAMLQAGYSSKESLIALDNYDWQIDVAKLVEIGFENNLSEAEIVSFLRECNGDPEEVEDDLRSNGSLDQKQRVSLMHHWLQEEVAV